MMFRLSFFIRTGRVPDGSIYIVSGASVQEEDQRTWVNKTRGELRAYLPFVVSLIEYFSLGKWILVEIMDDDIYINGERIPLKMRNLSWRYISKQLQH